MTVAAREMSEKELQAGVVELAQVLGYRHYFTYRSKRSPAGWPDLQIVRERLILLELKIDVGKCSAAQKEWIHALLNAGCEIYVARPDDLDALALILTCRGAPWKTARGPALEASTRLHEATRKEVA